MGDENNQTPAAAGQTDVGTQGSTATGSDSTPAAVGGQGGAAGSGKDSGLQRDQAGRFAGAGAKGDNSGASAGEEFPDGHPVPFKRFSQVYGRAKSAETELEQLRRKQAEWEAERNHLLKLVRRPEAGHGQQQGQAATSQDPVDRLLDNLLGPEQQPQGGARSAVGNPQDAALSRRVQDLELQIARSQLESEFKAVETEFPGVPREVLRRAVAADGNADLRKVAQHWTSEREVLAQQAVAEFLDANPHLKAALKNGTATQAQVQQVANVAQGKAPPPPAPPAPKGTSGVDTGADASGKKPKTFVDAAAGLANALRRKS